MQNENQIFEITPRKKKSHNYLYPAQKRSTRRIAVFPKTKTEIKKSTEVKDVIAQIKRKTKTMSKRKNSRKKVFVKQKNCEILCSARRMIRSLQIKDKVVRRKTRGAAMVRMALAMQNLSK